MMEEKEQRDVGRDVNNSIRFKSLACSVEPSDFQTTLDYAATSDSILPALGVHPWYIPSLDLTNNLWLENLEMLLIEHPACLVGEIGLCKMARWVRSHPDGKAAAMDIQKECFKKQMELAAKLNRPVTVHSVNAHGIFLSIVKELAETSSLPPVIGMHVSMDSDQISVVKCVNRCYTF
jgi:Tat protein secretion system quality control protein TatD with DNase activity